MASSLEEIQRQEAHAYPSEHIGFLTTKHVKALDEFKQYCKEQGYWRPAQGEQPASHDDETLLRYLRARKWIIPEAFTQFKETEDWRKENQLDKLYECIDIHEYEAARRLYPQWTGRRDKRGIPVYIYEVSVITTKAVAAYENAAHKPGEIVSKIPPKLLRLFALYEGLITYALPLCSMIPDRPYPQTPVSQSSNIVDISNVSLKQFWNLKSHMQDASTLATAHYPETLDRIFILGAPSFFPTVWSWVKRWFDPITVSKIHILSKANTLSTLEQFVHIDDIPKKYGGNLDYEFGDLPNLDPLIQKNIEWIEPTQLKGRNTWPIGPLSWRKSSSGSMVATAVGSEHGKRRETPIFSIVNLPSTPANTDQRDKLTDRPITPVALERLPSGIDTHPLTPPGGDIDSPNDSSGTTTPVNVRGTPAIQTTGPTHAGSTYLAYRSTANNDTQAAQKSNQHDEHHDSSYATQAAPSATQHTEATTEALQGSTPPPTEVGGPAGTSDTVRTGTSSTRYEQQSSTHGAGQLRDTTPDVRTDISGDSHAVVETSTLSQAPKEHPLPQADEPPAPGIVEQAQHVATNAVEQAQHVAATAVATAQGAVGSVFAAVGLGGKIEPEPEPEVKRDTRGDELIDGANKEQIEEFLRDKHSSRAFH